MLSGSRPDFLLLGRLLPWNYNVTATLAFWSFVWREPDAGKPLFQVGWRARGAGPLSQTAPPPAPCHGRMRLLHLFTLFYYIFCFNLVPSCVYISTWDFYFVTFVDCQLELWQFYRRCSTWTNLSVLSIFSEHLLRLGSVFIQTRSSEFVWSRAAAAVMTPLQP